MGEPRAAEQLLAAVADSDAELLQPVNRLQQLAKSLGGDDRHETIQVLSVCLGGVVFFSVQCLTGISVCARFWLFLLFG